VQQTIYVNASVTILLEKTLQHSQIAISEITAVYCYTEDIFRGAVNIAWTGTSKSYLKNQEIEASLNSNGM